MKKLLRKITLTHVLLTFTIFIMFILCITVFFGFYYSSPRFRFEVINFGKDTKVNTVGYADYACKSTELRDITLSGKAYEEELERKELELKSWQRNPYLSNATKSLESAIEGFKNNPVISVPTETKITERKSVIQITNTIFGFPISKSFSVEEDTSGCICLKDNQNIDKDNIKCAWSKFTN